MRQHTINYLDRYGLTTLDLLKAELGGPRAADIRERANRILATQEAFLEPRATQATPLTAQSQQGGGEDDELVQSL